MIQFDLFSIYFFDMDLDNLQMFYIFGWIIIKTNVQQKVDANPSVKVELNRNSCNKCKLD